MELLLFEIMDKPCWMWLSFIPLVLGLLIFDLGVLHRKAHAIGMRESLMLSAFYVTLGVAFAGWIWYLLGAQAGYTYLTGYVVEISLSMDNLFVMALIFSYFAIPAQYQHRVLIYGILGVIILRGVMIGAGAVIVAQFHWVLYLFAAFLIFTGVKMLLMGDHDYDVGANPVLRYMRRHIRITDRLHGERFILKQVDPRSGQLATFVTPLFVALVMIEVADVIFAVDSVPAIFAITTDPYIVYTSNIFAILGLRAMYFSLVALLNRFVYLHYALSLVLIFIGAKVFVADMFDMAKIPPAWSLGITVLILASGVIASLLATRRLSQQTDKASAKQQP